MTLCELIPDASTWDINILATDASDFAIAQPNMQPELPVVERNITPGT